jgi:hypothetical protein
LGPHLDEALTSEEWNSWTFADPSVPASRLERFSQGGAISWGDVACHAWKEVATAMSADAPAAWLVPDPLGRPGDGFLKDVKVEHHAVEDAVYYVERTGDIELIAATWRQASSAAGQMALVTTHELSPSGLDAADLLAAAARAVLVAVSAYDGEGMLFCERPRP